jgi:hypothetical protein
MDLTLKLDTRIVQHTQNQVEVGGIKKKVKTSSLLVVMKNRAKELHKAMQKLPMRLLDLGTRGLRWVRDIPGMMWDQATRFDALQSGSTRCVCTCV